MGTMPISCTKYYLALGYGHLLAVSERVEGDAPGSLLVTLLKGLLHDAIGPVDCQILGLGRVAEVSTVDETLEQLCV